MSLAIQNLASPPTPSEPARPQITRRILFISYVFPPVGGAGVQRTTKFVKYLPSQGWQPSVLTVQNPSVPAFDSSLLADIPDQTLIRRARTLEPSYAVKNSVAAGNTKKKSPLKSAIHSAVKLLLQPDPQVLWAPDALKQGAQFLREHRPDIILVSGPPFSSFLIGARLARRANLPLVLDYRDEWDISNTYLENKKLDPASLWLQRRMQFYAMRSAAAVIATTKSSSAALEKIRDLSRSKATVHTIYNGYDPNDFPLYSPRLAGGNAPQHEKCDSTRDRFRLAYVGTLWNLTSIAPIVEALELLARRSPDLAAKLELIVVGRRTDPQQQLLNRLQNLNITLTQHPYLPHDEALDLVRDADALCVLLSDVKAAERVVPAKLFEYMAARRTILCVAPKGEMWDLLADHPAAHLHAPTDLAGITASLESDITDFRDHGPAAPCEYHAVQHSRPAEAAQLARLLESLLPKRRTGRGVA